MFLRIPLLSVITFAWTLSIYTCDAQKPTSDSTPPIVKWQVIRKPSNEKENFTGDGKVIVKPGETLTVTCIVQDPEGVQEIKLGATGTYSCSVGKFGQNNNVDQKTQAQKLSPDSNNKVQKVAFLVRDVDLNGWQCQSDATYDGGGLTLTGSGTNYFNGTTKSKLQVVRPS